MPQLSEVAHFTKGKAAPADVDTPEGQAWLVWNAMLNTRGSTEFARQGVDGVSVRVNVRDVCRSLWPSLHRDDLTQRAADVRAFIRQTGMAACLFPQGDGTSKTPVWWVAKAWIPGARATVVVHRETRQERKLTAAEAGEDRPPAPVTVKHRDDPAQTPEETLDVTAAVLDVPAEPETPDEPAAEFYGERVKRALVAALPTIPEPFTRAEWSLAAGIALASDEGSTTPRIDRTVTDQVLALVREGVVFRRDETRDERRIRFGLTADDPAPRARGSHLFWTAEPVPARTLRTVVPGFAQEARTPTVEEMRLSTKKSYDDALNRCLERLEQLPADSFTTLRKLAGDTSTGLPRMKWIFDQMLDAGLVQVKRSDSFLATRLRLARGTVKPTDPALFRSKVKASMERAPAADEHVVLEPVVETSPEDIVQPAELPAEAFETPKLSLSQVAADGSFVGRMQALLDAEVDARVEIRAGTRIQEAVDAAVASERSNHVAAQERIAELEAQVAKLKRTLAAYLE